VDALEGLRNLDLRLGTPVNYGRTEHQAVHKVWGTELDGAATIRPSICNKRMVTQCLRNYRREWNEEGLKNRMLSSHSVLVFLVNRSESDKVFV